MKAQLKNAFKNACSRNIAQTTTYMHVAFYNTRESGRFFYNALESVQE
jgi:cytochrome c peroxidase